MIGFSWEKESDIYAVVPQIIQIPAHQIRISVATPLPGSAWFKETKQENTDWTLYDTENLVWNKNNFSDVNSVIKYICHQFYTTDFYTEKINDFLHLHPKDTESFDYFFNSLVELGILKENELKVNHTNPQKGERYEKLVSFA